MAILPIDLQTLYTQLEKVGKSQVQAQQAAHAIREQDKEKNIRKADERMRTVHSLEAGEDSTTAIHDREGSGEEFQKDHEKKSPPEPEKIPIEKKEIIRDPALGKHIDVSG